ncbi:hypothetical protein E4U21_002556 [Claviceps maximensis]|nr:hypothetical protein E4U21_002556 [Claviceps maximensis]
MTTQLLATELANLIQESKRKHNDLRQAAEKSLEELKQLGPVTEQAAPELLSQKSNFVNPFIIACGTKNAKFTSIAIVCLQRLIVARALPEAKLDQVLEALVQASSAGLDVQLKILQALPSLLQNYSSELKGDLLVTALNICFILQSSKNAIVNNTSAATLQQLLVSVFDKVVFEDKNGSDSPTAGEVSAAAGVVQLRTAALDAYRIFNDLCLMTENQRPEFLRFSNLPQTFGLELIESVITNHASVFITHPEQAQILRVRAVPLIIGALKGKSSFATTVRLVRILYTMLRRHIDILPDECEDALDILVNLLDQESALWKRALCMEVFRSLFSDFSLIRKIFSSYGAQKHDKNVIKIIVATFVRLSTEKPSVIGLGHQSTVPITNSSNTSGTSTDQVILEAGMGGIIGGAITSEIPNTGISMQWSSIRVPCIDQLDKTDPPSIPESYVYSLILSCLSLLSDGLAKFILPLTVPTENRNRRKASKNEGRDSRAPGGAKQGGRDQVTSFKKNPIPVNPLHVKDHPLYRDVKICADLVDECWPAILATFSTFLYAALDSDYYHGLVRSFQRFAHVSGLLQLRTPRDAFLTTLGKSAVPPNLLSACLNPGQARPTTPSTPTDTPTNDSLFSNARGLLSVETLSPISPAVEKQRQPLFDIGAGSLNTRNLLCLRALLNLGIALGPTLGTAWGIIFETLRQADFVLFATGKTPGRTPSIGRSVDQTPDADVLMANFNTEIKSVETAATRLIESTVDFPEASFVQLIEAVCDLLEKPESEKTEPDGPASPSLSRGEMRKASGFGGHRRIMSFSSPVSTSSNQEYLFVLAKLSEIASVNLERLLTGAPDESGWDVLTEEVIDTLDSPLLGSSVRVRAAEVLSRLALEAALATPSIPESGRGEVQLRLLMSLRDALQALNNNVRSEWLSSVSTDVDVHRIILEGLKSIIEGCGENLVSGWHIAFEIIDSGFTSQKFMQEQKSKPEVGLLRTKSPKLTRSAFGSLQLICSDFLSSLPNSCLLILVDTLYKFCSQDDDLNIALTTVTFFWVLSDYLSAKANTLAITADLVQTFDESELEKKAADHTQQGSDAALWMLLLLKLAAVTSDERLDLRNSAIQTLLRIFDAYGDRLTPEAWSTCIKSVIFKLFMSLAEELRATAAESEPVDDQYRADWHGTAVVVLDGVSALLANHIDVLTSHPAFDQLWRDLLKHFAILLDFEILEINTATFKALSHILSQTGVDKQSVFNKTTVEIAWDLWARSVPVSQDKSRDNQGCLIAYVAALREIYQLMHADITVNNVRRMLTLLQQTVEGATVSTYVQDVEHSTNLQGQVLASVAMIRTDVEGVPSAIIKQVSQFIKLAYNPKLFMSGSKRTYVAMSKASIQFLEKTILNHATEKDVYNSGAFSGALAALHQPIALKYDFPMVTKSVQPWRMATTSVLSILDGTLPRVNTLNISSQIVQDIWATVVAVADGIVSAQCRDAPPSDDAAFEEDESFDILSFHKLRGLIIPALGAESIPNEARRAYAESLFRNSVIHNSTWAERALAEHGNEIDPSSSLGTSRAGRTASVLSTKRINMAYVAFDELFALVSAQKNDKHKPLSGGLESIAKSSVKETTLVSDEDDNRAYTMRNRIASTTAPFLILRCASTLRAYIADQPLRGHMPQPLSQRKELIWTLQKLIELRSRGEAIASLPLPLGQQQAEGGTQKHLLRLYPLLVEALGVGRDEMVSKLFREALDAVGTELGIA